MAPRDAESPGAGAEPDPPARPAGGLVRTLHDAVPGRARLHVAGLRRDPALAQTLDRGLTSLSGIYAASASPVTGNVLVRFDPALPLTAIHRRIEALIRGEIVAGDAEGTAPAWHALTAAEAAERLGSSPTAGLTPEQARARLAECGPNHLPAPPRRAALGILLGQFQTLPVLLLAAAASVSVLTGGALEAAAIAAVLALNGGIGFAVESRAERTIASLGAPVPASARVIRGGAPAEVPAGTLVPGDLILLRPGAVVPADARLVEAQDLSIGEATLTGESLPVAKTAAALDRRAVPLGDRRNIVHRGTAVTGGSGSALVFATGPRTEVGRIQALVQGAAAPETPLQRELAGMGRQLVWLSLVVCGAVFGLGALRGLATLQLLRSSLSLAVAAIPEGLPTVATTTLAIGVEEMRRRKVLVRRLDAVETLAAVQVICFDKTGTLTLNRMAVAAIACGGQRLGADAAGGIRDEAGRRITAGEDPGLARLLEIAALCSEALLRERPDGPPELEGSATENALVALALDAGLDVAALRRAHPRTALHYRSEASRFMLSAHRCPEDPDRALTAVKGDPGEVLELCAFELRGGESPPLTPERRAAIGRDNAVMAEQGLRVLGFAFRDSGPGEDAEAAEGLTWVGLAGMADPLRPGMPALIRALHRAGIHSLVMTGDQVPTARAVARQLGLAPEGEPEVLDALALDALSDALGPEALAAAARRAHVFARVSPAQKLRIVRALQNSGCVVAMTGDGINDSPALKAADVGIAVGSSGSAAAREVADLVLQTDDLAAIALAVERGRTTCANIRKSVRYLLSTNLSEIAVVLAATGAGLAEPLSVMQLLWINLISDVLPALGLAFEPPDPDRMSAPPRAVRDGLLQGEDLRQVGIEGGIIAAGALGSCAWGALRYGASARTRSLTFGSLVTAQLLHALTCRSPRRGAFAGGRTAEGNLPLTGALALSFAAQAAALLVPGLRSVLGIAPLGALDAAVMLAGGVAPYLANEAVKSLRQSVIAERGIAQRRESRSEP